MKPMIGISCCIKTFGVFGMANHAASNTYVRATDLVVGGVPVLIPANGHKADIATLLSRLDGLIFTGSRSNVHPDNYDGPAHAPETPEDAERDAVTLPLIRAAVAAGIPVLAICRGMQEMNVALGGSLHQRLQDLPDHIDHSTPMSPISKVRTGKSHPVAVTEGGWLHRITKSRRIAVNSLHNQGVDRLASGLVIDARAADGTVEAVHVLHSAGFAVGVQWHPEYDWDHDETSRGIFAAFADAVRARMASLGMQTAAE